MPTSTPDEGRFPPGTILSQRYRIAGRLGKGGMGEVYRATDMLLGQTVALKFLPEDVANSEHAVERLRSEVRLARQISHPNVCRVYDLGEANGQLFLTMEFIDGEDLASLLRRIGRLPAAKAVEISRRLCAGLAAAHEKNVLHRDLKPSNIMLDGRGQVLITDFGLAAIASELEPHEVRSGTPVYMSPEQLAGIEVTERSDLYSLGLVLYELFAGAPPQQAVTREELMRLRRTSPPPLAEAAPGVDPAVTRAIMRCLDPVPANRPRSALALAAALPGGDPLAAALAMGETPSPDAVAAAEPARSMRPRVAVAAFVALTVLMVAGAALIGSVSVFSPVAGIEPAVMAQAARDVLGSLGYASQDAWSEWAYAVAPDDLVRLGQLDAAVARRRIAEDTPAYFWYRTSPEPMVATRDPFNTFVTQTDPPVDIPGMVLVHLSANRLLLLLKVIPPERDGAKQQSPQFDWSRLFAAAGLDSARFATGSPLWTPPSAFDARAAWVEKQGSDPLRVEAAAWHGRPVFFRVVRNSAAGLVEHDNQPGLPFLVYNLLVVTAMAVLVFLNVRKRRGDFRGAFRFGLFIAAVIFLYHLVVETHTPDGREWRIFVSGWGNALWAGTYSALGYLAFEPFVRRKWPHALVSWTRLLAGRFRDPLVGQDVLVGLLFGAGITFVLGLLFRELFGFSVPFWRLLSSSPIRFASFLLGALAETAISTAAVFCLLFVAVRLCRIGWVAACVTAAIMSTLLNVGAPHPLWTVPVYLLLYTAALLVAVRFGALALGSIAFVTHFGIAFPLTLDTSAFYFGPSLGALALIVGLGAYACRNAIAGARSN